MDKTKLQITGYSDDIISLDGSIYDEFSPSGEDDTAIIRLSDGTKIKVFYDSDGIWRTEVLGDTALNITIENGDVKEDTNDVLIVHAPIQFLTWSCKDGKKGAIGDIPLPETQQKIFDNLQEVLEYNDDFDEKKNVVKALLAGIEF